MSTETETQAKIVYTGRKQIFTNVDSITIDNLLDVLNPAIGIHEANASDIDYLYNYYKGTQDIIFRTKNVRPEICNKIIVNYAHFIVNFRAGHFLSEDIQYVCRNSDDKKSADDVIELNNCVNVSEKNASDIELVNWMFMVGTGYRMVQEENDTEDAPFGCYTLDPRYTFVIYRSDLTEKPLMGVKVITKVDSNNIQHKLYSCFTDNMYYEVENNKITKAEGHILGAIPIVEYPIEKARIGFVELVKDLLDLKNNLLSNRMDAVEQFVQAFLFLKGFKLESGDLEKLRECGALSVADPASGIDYITAELNQTQIQTLVEYIDNTINKICGIPTRTDGTTSDSSNNKAVILSYGWADTETDAETIDKSFIRSERQILKVIINILNAKIGTDLKSRNIEIKIPRTNYENMLEKSQFFSTMIATGAVSEEVLYNICKIFPDPSLAYSLYLKEKEAEEKKSTEMLEEYNTAQISISKANAETVDTTVKTEEVE